MPSLLTSAPALFQGAAQTQEGISERAYKTREGELNRRSATSDRMLSTGIETIAAGQRQRSGDAAAMERQKVSEAGANQRQQEQIEAQFLTLTPQLKKGAAKVTGDNSWNEIPDNFKMRADVYSGLVASGVTNSNAYKPQTLEIKENDQVYTAEYDPKNKTLRKLTTGSADSDLEKARKPGGGAALNPFTLQNIIRNDEKTLLEQLGGKGKKGIPSKGMFGYSDKEKAKLETLRSLATRTVKNYQNLRQLEIDRGLQPTDPDPEMMSALKAIINPGGASGSKVRLIGVDGKGYMFDSNKVDKAVESGQYRRP